MKVYTYFAPVPELRSEIIWRDIRVWGDSWRRHGWEPEVLTRKHVDLVGPERAAEAERIIRARPTINPAEYTLATSLRWFALEGVGGGMMTDLDVVNLGFRPEDIPDAGPVFTLCRSWIPACVYATAEGARTLTEWIITNPSKMCRLDGDHPHLSDQWIFTYQPPGPALFVCLPYNERKPDTKLVHCSASALSLAGVDPLKQRWEVMEELTR